MPSVSQLFSYGIDVLDGRVRFSRVALLPAMLPDDEERQVVNETLAFIALRGV